ncbi:hypothetical protein ACH4JZ_27250 [Streptomyces sp. NPDC017615]|uniref:hypothetical protein n=1 Tax=Streptomyces sp. NPDC017615 TaxID=3365003 RepID=UPI0037B7EEFC
MHRPPASPSASGTRYRAVARQHVLPDEPPKPHQVGPLTLPHVRNVHDQFSGLGRRAATP